VAGPISYDELKGVLERHPSYKRIEVFIETGTYLGETIFPMAKFFKKLYTIELSPKHHKNAVKKASQLGITNIEFLQGYTEDVLPDLIRSIQEPAVFFLDAHFCGAETDSEETTVPLLQELEAINKHRDFADLLILDDAFVFGKDIPERRLYWSSTTTENILSSLEANKVLDQFVENDRHYIFLRESSPNCWIPSER